MTACFGIFNRDGAPVSPDALARMDAALAYWGADGGGLQINGAIALGSRLRKITPEDQHERQPLTQGAITLVAHVRLDNRADLCRAFALANTEELPDSRLIAAAYQRFGLDCVQHLKGDWVFALWDQAEGRLLLARDASGNTGLYWWQAGNTLVFATGMKGILAYPAVVAQPDLHYIAGLLTVFSDPEYADSSAYQDVRRLLPGHLLLAQRSGTTLQRWWRPETLTPLHLPRVEDYYAAFLECYQEAVTQRLRAQGGSVAATLSGGLDSGSVVALAAPHLAQRGEQLLAYVHCPHYPPSGASAKRTGDELALAQQTADYVGNIAVIPLRSEHYSVLTGIERALWVHDAPGHAAGNQYWIIDLLTTAHATGAKVILTGQGGNATVSYNGLGSLLPELLRGQVRSVYAALRQDVQGGWHAVRQRLLKPLLRPSLDRWRTGRQWWGNATPWADYSAINPHFAQELGLRHRMQHAGFDPSFARAGSDPKVQQAFRLGTYTEGKGYAFWMQQGAAAGVDVRDPTKDQRLVEFCWRVPDAVFWGAGQRRALIRQGMAQHLPAAVRYNPHKGLQSADIAGRLQHEASAVHALLTQQAGHPLAQACLDLPKMQAVYERLKATGQPAPDLVQQAQAILVRGLGVGGFLFRH